MQVNFANILFDVLDSFFNSPQQALETRFGRYLKQGRSTLEEMFAVEYMLPVFEMDIRLRAKPSAAWRPPPRAAGEADSFASQRAPRVR